MNMFNSPRLFFIFLSLCLLSCGQDLESKQVSYYKELGYCFGMMEGPDEWTGQSDQIINDIAKNKAGAVKAELSLKIDFVKYMRIGHEQRKKDFDNRTLSATEFEKKWLECDKELDGFYAKVKHL